jgi:hypothetical protein
MKNALIIPLLLIAISAASQTTGPNVQFKSLFQIRAALPDTIELIHIAYNISITPQGVEILKVTPPVGQPQQIPVPAWVEENGKWVGITKDGITVIWDTTQEEPFLEIATPRQVLDMYVMAPVRLRWERFNDN